MSTYSFARGRACIRTVVIACGALLALSACEVVDEGVTDYRKATLDSEAGNGSPTSVFRKYTSSDRGDPKINAPGDAVAIPVGKTFYVSALQAYISSDANFHSWGTPFQRDEMVVILRVHDSNNDATDEPAKLVFYSDDVERGQFLNFSNLVTFGPTTYMGGVITIDVDEINLVRTTDDVRKELTALAAGDRSFVGPDPASRHTFERNERDLLDGIERDGHGTRYTLTLLPAGGVNNLPYPRFEAGNYVVVRTESRTGAPFDWSAVKLDNNTGRLIYPSDEANAKSPCSDDQTNGKLGGEVRCASYVTVQINALDTAPYVSPQIRQLPTLPRPRAIEPPCYKPLTNGSATQCLPPPNPPKS
jgi:hypothetical protein